MITTPTLSVAPGYFHCPDFSRYGRVSIGMVMECCGALSPASHMGPLAQAERQQHGTTPAPVMGPPQRQ